MKLTAYTSPTPDVSMSVNSQGGAWKKHEMQALNMLVEANSHSLIQRFGKAMARDRRSRNLYMRLGYDLGGDLFSGKSPDENV